MSRAPAYDVSVVIPNWNGAKVLPSCLDALVDDLRSSGLEHEVIVVDDASEDDSTALVSARYPGVRLVVNPRNSGFAFSCNRGFRRARGAFLLVLNNDAVVHPGCIRRVLEFLSSHTEVGGAGCRILTRDGALERSCRDFPTLPNLVKSRILRGVARCRPAVAARLTLECWPHDAVRPVDWIHMVFFMISRRAYATVGGLDERFFMYGEDADYGYRLRRAGFQVIFVPEATVTHLLSYSGGMRWGAMAMLRRQRALHELQRKWHPAYHRWAYRLGMAALLGLRLGLALARRALGGGAGEDPDFETAALLFRCNLGLPVHETI